MRIGSGYDVHRLEKGRKLVLGGVTIPFEKGLAGHSDADVLTHAICDAILGAAGLGDIGVHFPDTDARFENIYSIRLLEQAADAVREKGFAIVNIDATVIAQAPKLSPYRQEMTANIAAAARIDAEDVNIKATTTEGLGITGRGEGIAAMAVTLLKRSS
ncbi:MAG: 2-C-methyl-D-erythritol 2,4-cyclodiphosphate synthase [Thermodesulfobacteriota bacterium]|nr:2-C-methyl-D-erythritol 2,4-cyclodiphosphate synthase [Thermodesulfobacteriota bacterium]